MANRKIPESNPERGIIVIPSDDYRKDNTNRGASITRDPLIPLMEEEKGKALDKEIVIDFNNRVIKAKDPNTGEFVEFNSNTVEQIFNDQGLKLVLLDDTVPITDQASPDFKSIDIIDGVFKIHGFNTEDNFKIPINIHGEVLWQDPTEALQTAGNLGGVEEAKAGNNNLFVLGVRKAQVTDEFPNSPEYQLVIPNRELTNDYMRIVWKVTTDDNYIIKFPKNTYFECTPFIYDEETVFDPNTIYIVSLETFNRGVSWFCSCRGFAKKEEEVNPLE